MQASASTHAHTCIECGGCWLAGSNVERWQKMGSPSPTTASYRASSSEPGNQAASTPPSAPTQVAPSSNDKKVARCPEGHGFLRRARIEEAGFSLDRCSPCGGVWFDAGEWEHLAEENLIQDLSELWDPAYRAAKRQEQAQKRIDEALVAAIGAESFTELSALADRLRGHPAKSQALAWLRSALE